MKKTISITLAVIICSAAIIGFIYAVKNNYPTASPEQTVKSFYDDWIKYQGAGNPISDRIYQESQVVTDELVKKLDSIIYSFEFGGYDPVICAQDIPQSFKVELKSKNNDLAILQIEQDFYGSINFISVETIKIGKEWKINDIICQKPVDDVEKIPAENDRADKDNGISVSHQNLVSDYIRQNISALSPEKEVLGGKFYITSIDFNGPKSAIISYEDGHIAFEAKIEFEVNINNEVKIESFDILPEKNNQKDNDKQIICIDKCGDGICDEIVCMGEGCPCPETPQTCPQDCQ